MTKENKKQVIYQAKNGAIELRNDTEKETILKLNEATMKNVKANYEMEYNQKKKYLEEKMQSQANEIENESSIGS